MPLRRVERDHSRMGRCPANSTVAGTAFRRGYNMVSRLSCRDSAVVTGRAGSYDSRMVNLGNRDPGKGRVAGITVAGGRDMRRRFAGGGRAVVTGRTGSYYTRMVKLHDRLPCAG